MALQIGTRLRATRRERLAWAASGLCVLTTPWLGVLLLLSTPAAAQESRLELITPPDTIATSFALSPDGNRLVYARRQLWVRSLNSETAQPLEGTEGGMWPFWSPDGKSVGFFNGRELQRIELEGGKRQRLATATHAAGWGTWNADGTILFVPALGPVMRVEATGARLAPATRVDPPRQVAHRFPEFLPDGRHFLFLVTGAPEHRGVYVGSLDSADTHRLFESDSPAKFLPPDRVLFSRGGALLAQRLNLDTLRLQGDPSAVAPRVAWVPGDFSTITVSASASGHVAYRAHLGQEQFQWLDRTGKPIGTLGPPDTAEPTGNGRLSRDGRTLAAVRTVDGNPDIWLIDVQRGDMRRLTTEPSREGFAAWSPDDRRIAYASARRGGSDLFARSADGSGTETELLVSSENKVVEDWARDFLLYRVRNPTTDDDLWVLPLTGDRKPVPVVQGPSADLAGRFSRDARWVAYHSAESGRNEVYVQPFPGPGSRIQITTEGGQVPEWRSDGRELFYRGPGDRVFAVPIMTEGTTLKAGTPESLFTLPSNSRFVESIDGQRFLVLATTQDEAPVTVLVNWPGIR